MSYIPPNPNGQATSANSAPVVIASDQSAVAISGTVTANAGTGSFSVAQATASSLNAQVFGGAAAGSAVSGNPVLVAGTDGTNARTVKLDSNGAAFAADATTVINGSQTSAAVLFTQDMTGYNSISVQVTSAGTTCTITYEGSNDNTTFYSIAGNNIGNTGTTSYTTTTTAVGIWTFPKQYRYFRARVSTYTSGTVTVVAYPLNAILINPNMSQIIVSNISTTSATNGTSKLRFVTAATTNLTAIKATSGKILAINCYNTAAYDIFLKIYNIASGSVTVGTSAISYTFAIKSLQNLSVPINDVALYFANSTGFSCAVTKLAGDSDTTATVAGDGIIQIDYI